MKNNFIKIIRFGLRIHSIFHFVEFITAIYEEAYITSSIVQTYTKSNSHIAIVMHCNSGITRNNILKSCHIFFVGI